jgi:hypothetical protein
MPGDEFRSVLLVKRAVALVVDSAGRGVISLTDGRTVLAEDRYLWLLPLLEKPRVEVEAAVSGEAGIQLFQLSALVRFALVEGSRYWIGRALAWLEGGFPASDVVDVLQPMKDDSRLPQPLRHRALRLWLPHRGQHGARDETS